MDLSTKGQNWPYFSDKELRSPDLGYAVMDKAFMDRLVAFREEWGAPLIVNSAYRSEKHNSVVGGAPNSQHRKGTAIDISMAGVDVHAFLKLAFAYDFTGIGVYLDRPRDRRFVHLDLRVGNPVAWAG